jgi:hypothetical protein
LQQDGLLFRLSGTLTDKVASGRFSEQHSVFRAMAILLRAWYSALSALPSIIRQRWAYSKRGRIGRRELYRLFCEYRISAYEIAIKE